MSQKLGDIKILWNRGELLRAYKKAVRTGDLKKMNELLNRVMMHVVRDVKTESNVPKELREQWAKEDGERAMRSDKTSKSTSIPQSLREKWKKEDKEKVMKE